MCCFKSTVGEGMAGRCGEQQRYEVEMMTGLCVIYECNGGHKAGTTWTDLECQEESVVLMEQAKGAIEGPRAGGAMVQ